jgi:hypothetical protein
MCAHDPMLVAYPPIADGQTPDAERATLNDSNLMTALGGASAGPGPRQGCSGYLAVNGGRSSALTGGTHCLAQRICFITCR